MIQARHVEIQACYQRELAATPTLVGRIVVAMTIEESGAVEGVHVSDSSMTGGDRVGACVVRVIDDYAFHPGATGGSVTYRFPLVFEPAP